MYLDTVRIQDIAYARHCGHKPDTFGRSNAVSPMKQQLPCDTHYIACDFIGQD